MAKIQARVLAPFYDGGKQINPNNLVEGDADLIKSMEKNGTVDTNKAAVAYCKDEGATAIAVSGDGFDFAAAEHAADIAKAEESEATDNQ